MDFFLFLIISLLTGVLSLYVFINRANIRSEIFISFFMLFLLSTIITISKQSGFNEINTSDYDFVINKKQECLKYFICEKFLKDILKDGKIKNYELKNFKEILDKANEEEYQLWIQGIENERKKKNEEELIKIKKELENK